ncbi:hypothetical protein ACOME3_007139 [Neoechinorhynchus agilis]
MRDRWRQSTPTGQSSTEKDEARKRSPSPQTVADINYPIPMSYSPLKPLQKADRVSSDSQITNRSKTVEGEEMKFTRVLNAIESDLNVLEGELKKFSGKRDDQLYVYLEEMLTKCLIGCDSVVSDSVGEEIRTRRRLVVKKCQALVEELEKKVKEEKPEIVIAPPSESVTFQEERELKEPKVRRRIKSTGQVENKRISEEPIPMNNCRCLVREIRQGNESTKKSRDKPPTQPKVEDHLQMLSKLDRTIDDLAKRLNNTHLSSNEKLDIDEQVTRCILDCDNITGQELGPEVRKRRKDVIKKAQHLLDQKQ